jgi:hypothetical protein
MKRFATVLLILISLFCHGQQNNYMLESIKPIKIKAYLNINKYDKESTRQYAFYYIDEEEKKFSIGNISLALELIRNNKTSHEFELMPFSMDINDEVEIIPTITASMIPSTSLGYKTIKYKSYTRYQFNYSIFDHGKNVRPYAGLATGILFERKVEKPYVIYKFQKVNTNFVLPLEIVAGFEIKLSNRLLFNVNIPVIVNKLVLDIERTDNPSVTEKLRKTTNLHGVLLPKMLQIRAGICFSFNHKNN